MMPETLSEAYLTSPRVKACFAARSMLRHMLAFEAALAAAQAELGIIPAAAAAVIVRTAGAEDWDIAALVDATAETSTPAIPLVDMLTARVALDDAAAARWVHWGATSQDVMDSAAMRCTGAAMELLTATLGELEARLCELAETHRHTPQVARTLAQHAGPTTFGVKVAGWLNGIVHGRRQLQAVRAALPLQFGGASGTLAAFADQGLLLAEGVGRRLGLQAGPPWHTERAVVRDIAAALAQLSAAAGKAAHDIVLMAQSEVGELREAAAPGRGVSSALPHKRNPVAAIAVVAAAHQAPGLLGTVFATFEQAHERAAGAWHAEQRALSELCVVTGAALEQLAKSLRGLEVDAAAMRRNLARGAGANMSEAVTMALARALGRGAAQRLVRQALAAARGEGCELAVVLAREPQVIEHLGSTGLARALDPGAYLGVSDRLIDAALARARTR